MTESRDASRTRSKLILFSKFGLTVLVLVFVGRRSWVLIANRNFSDISVCPGWLAASGLLYAFAWFPSVWFWRDMMRSMGEEPELLLCSKAYYAGHLGKYIPGKAGVLLIRSAYMKEAGHRFGVAILTAAYETLIVMGVGLIVAGSLASLLIPEMMLAESWKWIVHWRWLPAAVLLTLAITAIPVITWILSIVARKFAKSENSESQLSSRQLSRGYLVFAITWAIMGLSLGAALQSLSDDWLSLADWPLWTAAISSSTVIGFFAIFTPGGLGVREGIMMEVLRIQPNISADDAALVAWLLRVVWLLTELAAFAFFWCVFRWRHSQLNRKNLVT